jgi:hypothetical protein
MGTSPVTDAAEVVVDPKPFKPLVDGFLPEFFFFLSFFAAREVLNKIASFLIAKDLGNSVKAPDDLDERNRLAQTVKMFFMLQYATRMNTLTSL